MQRNPLLKKMTALGFVAAASLALTARAEELLDQDFERDTKGWAKSGVSSIESEDGNSFLRIESTKPGKMFMVYREVRIPEGTEAIKISWKQRVSNLELGTNSWFDARIMMEFADANRGKVSPKPPAPNVRKDTRGWDEKSITINVPEKAAMLKFMPTLFNVQAGTYDLDDIEIETTSKK